MLELIEQRAESQGFKQVKAVYLDIGALACVETDALTFCFDAVCRGTLMEGAELSIRQEPAHAWCFECEREVSICHRLEPCPNCGKNGLLPRDGDHMRINRLEVC